MHKEMDMTSGNIFKKLVVYAIPLVFTGILQLLYNAADLVICGMFGSPNSTAAISSTNSLTHLIVNLFMGLSVGANVLMARCYGEKNKEKGQRVVYTAMVFSIIVGIGVGAFGFFFSRYFLEMMGTTSDVIHLSTQYLQIYFLGLPFSMIYNFGASILRATGDTKRPFIYLASSGVFNVLFNILFVVVFKMDVPGVALGTIISQAISAVFIIIHLFKSNGFFHFKLSELKLYPKEALAIARIGLPAGLQGVIFSLSNVLIQSSINSLGTDVVGGNGAAGSLEGFIYISMNSIAQSCVAFVSANYGAQKKENIKKSIIYSSGLVILMNLIVGAIVLVFQNQLLGLYVHTEEAMEAGRQRIIIIALTYFLCGLMDVLANSLRGIGYSVLPMIVSLAGVCGIRIFWIYTIFPMENFNNIQSLSVSYPISWIVTASIHLICFILMFKKIKFKTKIEA
jgi:putative MATE family efflux protein